MCCASKLSYRNHVPFHFNTFGWIRADKTKLTGKYDFQFKFPDKMLFLCSVIYPSSMTGRKSPFGRLRDLTCASPLKIFLVCWFFPLSTKPFFFFSICELRTSLSNHDRLKDLFLNHFLFPWLFYFSSTNQVEKKYTRLQFLIDSTPLLLKTLCSTPLMIIQFGIRALYLKSRNFTGHEKVFSP